jgi:phenylacetate-coenzyme A ligase PaaK-like adenylate-forming protein
MFDLTETLNIPPFSLKQQEKNTLFKKAFSELTKYHAENCLGYRKILEQLKFNTNKMFELEELPFIPVRLFKEFELCSVDKSQIVKTMMSSGTSGQNVSRIFLDKSTSTNQTKVLTKLVSSFTGKNRLPMLVIDTSATLKDRKLFSARGAGILGFSMLGYDVTYALNEDMEIDLEEIFKFLEKHKDEKILLFGFTFMIWEHFYRKLKGKGIKLSLNDGIMIHGGGWKKLSDQEVDNDIFKALLREITGLEKVYNYYGMVEQTGSIFMECEFGNLHASIFSDIIIRDYMDFRSLEIGKPGLIQLLSLLPGSYPGHSILSEDLGEILGVDDCPCGRLGKYFRVYGRLKNAEIRGCSDTYASNRQ